MNYPVWDVGVGLPIIIAIVANVHVFVAHFAVGGGLFLVLTETIALKRNDTEMLAYTASHSRFFILLTLVFGAITGVGIWFTIGLIHPAATSSLIHLFVWFWASEWVMFFVEIAASMLYYHTWKRLPHKTHLAIGWVYFIAAWMSLFVINGIITFMLTPGQWLTTGNIWHAYFNPTFLPSLIVRTLLAFVFAGLFAFYTASKLRNTALKIRIMRLASLWSLPSLGALFAASLWYYHGLPQNIADTIASGWTALNNSRNAFLWVVGLLGIGIIFSPLLRPKGMSRLESTVLLILGLSLIGSFEWYREAARKPYVLQGYMYSNELLAEKVKQGDYQNLSDHVKWKSGDPAKLGDELLRAACLRCHSLSGYQGLATSVINNQWNTEHLVELIPRVGNFNAPMPPFVGTPEEAELIAQSLYQHSQKLNKPPKAVYNIGEHLWKKNCGLCHTADYFTQNGTFTNMELPEIADIIMLTGEMMEEMPQFLGSEEDALKLAEYISSITSEKTGAKND